MNKKRWKNGITVFGMILFGIMISNFIFREVFLFIWLLMGIAVSISYIAKTRGVAAHYGISFDLALLFSVMLLVSDNMLTLQILMMLILFFGMVALYRTCYQEKLSFSVLKSTLKNVKHLMFINLSDYFMPLEKSIEEKETKMVKRIGAVLAVLAAVVFIGLGRFADANIAEILIIIWEFVDENIIYLVFSIVGGIGIAIFLYGYTSGLMDDRLGDRSGTVSVTDSDVKGEVNQQVQIYHNPICGKVVLNAVLLWNCFILLVNIIFYWNPVGIHFTNIEHNYYSDGLFLFLIILIFNCCIFAWVSYVLAYSRNMMAAKKGNLAVFNDELLRVCRRKLTIVVLTAYGIWIFAIARYGNLLYDNGINGSNRQWLFWLLVIGIALGYFMMCGLAANLRHFRKKYAIVSAGIVIVTAFFWCHMMFPMYNLLLFEHKINNDCLASGPDKMSDGDIVILKQDIDILFMEEAGLYAVPSLLKLLKYNYNYEGTDESVSRTALNSIENIFCNEFYEDRKEIQQAEGIEKLTVIAAYMQDDPGYLLGIRRVCLQAVLEFIGKGSIS